MTIIRSASSLPAPPRPGFVASLLGQLMVCTCSPAYDARQMMAEAEEANSFEFDIPPQEKTTSGSSSSSSSYASHPFASAPILVGRYRKNEDTVEKTQKKKSSIFRIKPGRFMDGMDDLRVTHYPLSPVPSCDMTASTLSSSVQDSVCGDDDDDDDDAQVSDVSVSSGVVVKAPHYETQDESGIFSRGNSILACGDDGDDDAQAGNISASSGVVVKARYEQKDESGIFSRGNSILSCGDDDNNEERDNIIGEDDIMHAGKQSMQWESADMSVEKLHDQAGREVALPRIETNQVSLVGRAA